MAIPTNSVKPFDPNREYTGGQYKAQARFEMVDGDPRVHNLFVEYTNFPQRAVYWPFRKKVIDLALILFSGQYNWFVRQDTNALINDQNYAFLLDTIRFIGTGRRRISIYSWPTLLTYEPPVAGESVDNRNSIAKLFVEVGLSFNINELIQKWLSHKGGFDDLVFTMHMLFGNRPDKVS